MTILVVVPNILAGVMAGLRPGQPSIRVLRSCLLSRVFMLLE